MVSVKGCLTVPVILKVRADSAKIFSDDKSKSSMDKKYNIFFMLKPPGLMI